MDNVDLRGSKFTKDAIESANLGSAAMTIILVGKLDVQIDFLDYYKTAPVLTKSAYLAISMNKLIKENKNIICQRVEYFPINGERDLIIAEFIVMNRGERNLREILGKFERIALYVEDLEELKESLSKELIRKLDSYQPSSSNLFSMVLGDEEEFRYYMEELLHDVSKLTKNIKMQLAE